MELGVITNPNSRKNKGRRNHTASLQRIVGPYGEVHETPSPAAVKTVVRDFLRRDVPLWVADGGDGALHWMVRYGLEVLEEDEFAGKDLPVAIPTNGGTIDFVAHNVGIKGDAKTILSRLRRHLEAGQQIESVAVKTMLIEGVEATADGDRGFSTVGFAAAVGGIGQRFFTKYYEAADPRPSEIVKVVARTAMSYPVASSPLRHLPGMPQMLRSYANEVFRPTMARLTVDGKLLAPTACTGIHIASMSINLGNVMRFFSEADDPKQLHAICGAPRAWQILFNVPRMYFGLRMLGTNLYDGPAREMTVEAVGDELLEPIIDGERYTDLRRLTFRIGPRVRIARVVGDGLAN